GPTAFPSTTSDSGANTATIPSSSPPVISPPFRRSTSLPKTSAPPRGPSGLPIAPRTSSCTATIRRTSPTVRWALTIANTTAPGTTGPTSPPPGARPSTTPPPVPTVPRPTTSASGTTLTGAPSTPASTAALALHPTIRPTPTLTP